MKRENDRVIKCDLMCKTDTITVTTEATVSLSSMTDRQCTGNFDHKFMKVICSKVLVTKNFLLH